MWYRISDKNDQTQQQIENGIDYKLVRTISENIIRNRLYAKREYNPSNTLVNNLVKKVINKLQDKYTRIELVRGKTTSEYLTPIIESTIDTVL